MTSLRPLFVAALCALSSAFPLCAQIVVQGMPLGAAPPKVERKIDEKAKEIYDRAVAETAKLESLQFDAQLTLEGAGAGKAFLPDELKGKNRYIVRFVKPAADAKPSTLPRHSIRAVALDGPNEGVVTVLHGGQALQVDAKKKSYCVGTNGVEMLVGMATASCPDWFHGESGMMKRSEPIVLELAGTATIDDLECDVVKVVREVEFGVVDGEGGEEHAMKMPMGEIIAFARADGLPRRFSMQPPAMGLEVDGDEMPEMPMPVTTVFGLKANPKVDDAMFSLAKPEGYEEVEFKMPGFGAMEGEDAEGGIAPPPLAVKAGDAAPEFALKDLDGKEVTLASLKGKVVLLDFWATWCGPCKAAMPTIQKLSEEYKAKDVVILGVNTWEQKKDGAKDYMASKKYTYGCLLNGDDLAKAYGISGIPTLVIIGKDGKVVEIEVGLSDATGDGLRKAIDAALKK